MRKRPIIGEKLWFGPRAFGWGWSPLSWEGWLVAGLVTIGIIAPIPFLLRPDHFVWHLLGTALLVIAAVVVCILKGTPPGGQKERQEFMAERERESRSDVTH